MTKDNNQAPIEQRNSEKAENTPKEKGLSKRSLSMEGINELASEPFPPVGEDPYAHRAEGWIN